MNHTRTTPPTPARRRRTLSVTCAADGRAHEVTDGEMAAGLAVGTGHYRALCGHRVTAAPMVAPRRPALRALRSHPALPVGAEPPARAAQEARPVAPGSRAAPIRPEPLPPRPPRRGSVMTERWWPRRDPEPGPRVRAVAPEGVNPRHLRWERVEDGWSARGITCAYARYTPARPWRELPQHAGGLERCPRCGCEYIQLVVDVTHTLGEQCADCQGYGCFGCGWNGRHDRPS